MMVYFINHLIHSLFNFFFFFQPGPYLTKNEIIKTEAPITQAKETFLLEFGLHPKDLDARQTTMVLSCVSVFHSLQVLPAQISVTGQTLRNTGHTRRVCSFKNQPCKVMGKKQEHIVIRLKKDPESMQYIFVGRAHCSYLTM